MRKDVTFKTEDGTELAGWFYAAGTTPAPCIVMAHGFSATKEMSTARPSCMPRKCTFRALPKRSGMPG